MLDCTADTHGRNWSRMCRNRGTGRCHATQNRIHLIFSHNLNRCQVYFFGFSVGLIVELIVRVSSGSVILRADVGWQPFGSRFGQIGYALRPGGVKGAVMSLRVVYPECTWIAFCSYRLYWARFSGPDTTTCSGWLMMTDCTTPAPRRVHVPFHSRSLAFQLSSKLAVDGASRRYRSTSAQGKI